MAGTEPVLAAGEAHGQRVVVTAFSPAKSEQLALLPAFPLMLGNALYWCAEGDEAASGLKVQRPGDLLEETGLIQWTEWDGTQFQEATDSSSSGLLSIRRLGAWQTAEGRSGASVLASIQETNVPAKGEVSPSATLPKLAGASRFSDWPQLLIWSLLGVLLLESFLFHRKAVF
jgi:hypothetical protein